MDDSDYPIMEDVSVTDPRIPIRGRPLSSRWPLALLPYDWRQSCIQYLTSTSNRIVKLGVCAALVVILLLLLCQVLLTSRRHHHYLFDYFSSRGRGGKGIHSNESHLDEPVLAILLPLELPRQLTDAVHQHGGLVLANTDWLVNEAATAVAEVVVRCGCNRSPNTHQHRQQYPSALCESLCNNAGHENFSQFPRPGPLLVLDKSLHNIGISTNFWLEDLFPRWLDMAHAQEVEIQRAYSYLNDSDVDTNTDSFSKSPKFDLNSISAVEADYQSPYTMTPIMPSSSTFSYLTTLQPPDAKQIRISGLELQSRLHNLLMSLHHSQPNTRAYVDRHSKASAVFEAEFVPRNNRLRSTFDRTITGFIADPTLIDVMWKGAFATFVIWDEWLEEPAKALMAVRKAATDFNLRTPGSGEGDSQHDYRGREKSNTEQGDLQLALHVETMCSEALRRLYDARTAADALAQRMDSLHKLAKTYSASGWRVRKSIKDLERDGLVSVQIILDLLGSGDDIVKQYEPMIRREDYNDHFESEDQRLKKEAHLKEQVIDAWMVWPVEHGAREEIEKVARLLSPRKRRKNV